MPEALFIINPVSNRGATSKTWEAGRQKLVKAGVNFREHVTARPGEAIAVTRQAIRDGAQSVIAVGGDGTLNEVVNGYLDDAGRALNPQACIGILPSGTGSDFRRSVGLTTGEDTIRAIVESRSRMIDALHVEYQDREGKSASRFAVNVVSFGLGGEVVGIVNAWRGRLPNWVGGRARFIAGAIRALGQFRSKRVKIVMDDAPQIEIDSNLIIAANGRFAGSGMMFAPNAELDDGLMDIILTDCVTRLDVIKELPRIFRGAHLKNPKVREEKAHSITITTDEPLAVDIDGEGAGFTPAKLAVLPSALRLIA